MRYFTLEQCRIMPIISGDSDWLMNAGQPFLRESQCKYMLTVWNRKYFTFEYSVPDENGNVTTHTGECGGDDRVLI